MHDKAEILAVDDTPANLRVIADTLSPAGYIVAAVTSGERALKRLHTYIPDLILLDIQMPGMDGFETCRQIKENPYTASIPIIFVTALSDDDSISKGFALGAVDYITKPFREAEILARVKTHLQLRNLTANLEKQVEQRTADLSRALKELQSSQMQLVQQEKMATLGNLVAGVAHEINNPLGFIGGNVEAAQEHLQDLLDIVSLYRENTSVPDAIAEAIADIDPEFIAEDFPKLIASMQSGCDRIHNISTSLRTFSRIDTDKKTEFNLHEGLDSTLLILKYRLKANEDRPKIEIIKNYGELPEVKCYAGQVNQVFMNILANAIDALEENNAGKSFDEIKIHPNRITINTELSQDKKSVIVGITDNGKGMSEEVRGRIFDRGFTTKRVGKGTGLGMAIAHQIVTEKHGGAIACHSEFGKGTEFIISLPLDENCEF
ncbi:MAG: sensor histidine kinase [Spirulina sp.]